jgi:Asp/Glu/hydantoin racemase
MFRVTIISPLRASEADLARRQRRYGAQAGPGTTVTVVNLDGGPPALETLGDIEASAAVIARQMGTVTAADCDAILVDCVYDPAVDELRDAGGVPAFGPTRLTLPLAAGVARRFSIVSRTERLGGLLADLMTSYGYGAGLASVRTLGLSYEEGKDPVRFEAAMCGALRRVAAEDGAEAVVLGSTTMAVTEPMREAAGSLPLFMPGLVALRVLEQLWQDGLWPAERARVRA